MNGCQKNMQRYINGTLHMLPLILMYLLLIIFTYLANKDDNIFYCSYGTSSVIYKENLMFM